MKKIRKLLCILMAAALLQGILPAHASQEKEYSVIFENDFESRSYKIWDRIDGAAYYTQTDAEHGSSMAMNMDSDVILWKYFKDTKDSDIFYISFDVNSEYQYVNSYFKLLSKRVDSLTGKNEEYVIEPFYIRLDPLTNWHIGFLRDPEDWDAPDGMEKEFTHKTQKWYHVEMWLDIPNRSIYCYLDGEYRGRTGIPESFDKLCGMAYKSTRRDNGHYFLKVPATGKPELWLDNFKIFGFSGEDAPYESATENVPYQMVKKVDIAFSSTPGNINYEAEKVYFDVNISNLTKADHTYDVSYLVTDEGDNPVWSLEEKLDINAGEEKSRRVDIESDFKYGFYKFSVNVKDPLNGVSESKLQKFSNLHIPAEGVKNSKLGFNNHQKYRHGDPSITFPLQSKIGVSLIRDGMAWEDIEKQPHVYASDENYENWMKLAADNGLDVQHVFSYSNKLRTSENPPRSEEAVEAFGEFAYNYVKINDGRAKWFEVWNEYNAVKSTFNPDGGTPEDYFSILKSAYINAKKANPDVQIIGIDSARLDVDYTRRILEAGGGDYMDIVSFHPYPYNYANGPEEGQVGETTQQLRDIMTEYGIGDKELWLTELGFSSGENYMTEAQQANYVVRSMAITDELVDKIIWYVIQNKIVNDDLEANFGFIRAWEGIDLPYEAKPALLAISNWNALMTGAVTEEKYDFNACLKAYRFRRTDGKAAYVIWSTGESKDISLRLGADETELYDIYGNKKVISALNGAFNLRISEEPVYLIGDFEGFEPGDAQISIASGDELTVSTNDIRGLNITNSSQKELYAKLNLPANISLVSENYLPAGVTALNIKTEASSVDGSEVIFDITDGEKTYMYAKVPVEYKNAVDTALRVLPSGKRWQGVLTLKNNTNLQTIGGVLSVDSPNEVAEKIKDITIPELQPGEERTVRFNIPDSYSSDQINLSGNLTYDNGEQATIARSANLYPITYCSVQPTIDGKFDEGEWNGSVIRVNAEKYNKNIAAWGGPEDIGGDAYLMWDNKNLYLGVKITDDTLGYDVGQERLWAGDCVQFAVSPEHKTNSKHTEIAFGLVNGEVRIRRYTYRGTSIADTDNDLHNVGGNVEYKVSRDGTNTIYEMRIGWEELMPEGYNPKDCETLNFSMLFNENDGDGRRGWLEFGSGIGSTKNPSLFLELPFAQKE